MNGGGAKTTGKGAALLVGMPVITSPEGVRFWLELCGVSKRRDICEEAYAAFGTPPATQPQEAHVEKVAAVTSSGLRSRAAVDSGDNGRDLRFDDGVTARSESRDALPYGQAWFEMTMHKLRSLDGSGVTGVHVMAPSPAARRRAGALADAGVFGPRRV